jgi:pilus assembly protein Flp/PilA
MNGTLVTLECHFLFFPLYSLNEFSEKSMLLVPNERGQGLVEYALIIVLVAVVVIAVLIILGHVIGNVFSKINSSFPQ